MDKSDIFIAELILIFSLVIDISRYFHCRVWITSDSYYALVKILMFSTHSMKYIWYSPQKSKYPLFIHIF